MLGRYIDLGNPVSDHPLCRGLVSWWLPLPSHWGGVRLRDLVGNNHMVIQSGSGSYSPNAIVAPNGLCARLYGTGGIRQFHENLSPIGNFSLDAVTVACYIYGDCLNGTTNAPLVMGWKSGARAWQLFKNGTTNLRADVNLEGGTVSSSYVAYEDNRWHHVGFTYDKANVRLYIEGVERASSAYTAAISAVPTNLSIGNDTNYLDEYWVGGITSTGIWNRALSASEMWALSQDTHNGHPLMLRRASRAAWFLAEPAAAGSTAMRPLRQSRNASLVRR